MSAQLLARLQADIKNPGPDLGDDANDILVSQGRWRRLPAATLTANRAPVVQPTGAKAGDTITITRDDAEAFTLTLTNGGTGGGTIVVLPASLVGFADVQFDGTDWLLKRAGTVG